MKLNKLVKTSPFPLLTNGKNKANNINGISIESLFKYVLNCNFETINKPATITAWSTTETLFSKLKKAIERIIAKKESNLSFENILKLAMNYLDKESSNIASWRSIID